MGKPLSEMTLEELWELFPITLSPHRDCWKKWYNEEKDNLARVLPKEARISHIGSTAVSGIWAKPIIDILVEIPKGISMEEIEKILTEYRYILMSGCENRKSFNKGYTENGFAEKVYHLHLRYFGDNNELYFRDYINDNKDTAKEYEMLKLSLWKKYERSRDAYTAAKTVFIEKYTKIVKEKYGKRY